MSEDLEGKTEERLSANEKYLISNPLNREKVKKIISDVSEEYELSSVNFVLGSSPPFDLDTAPELSQSVLAALRERGMKIKRYEY